MTIIKNETQRLNLNAAYIWVVFSSFSAVSQNNNSCHICFSAVYKCAQYWQTLKAEQYFASSIVSLNWEVHHVGYFAIHV